MCDERNEDTVRGVAEELGAKLLFLLDGEMEDKAREMINARFKSFEFKRYIHDMIIQQLQTIVTHKIRLEFSKHLQIDFKITDMPEIQIDSSPKALEMETKKEESSGQES